MKKIYLVFASIFLMGASQSGCVTDDPPESSSGVRKTSVKVQTDASGLTTEQKNIRERLTEDNRIGSIKHLYVISAYSGQVLIYSTVKGKVTSGGKRLTPTTIEHSGRFGWSDPSRIKSATGCQECGD